MNKEKLDAIKLAKREFGRLLLFALVFLGGCAFVLFLLWLLLKGVWLG